MNEVKRLQELSGITKEDLAISDVKLKKLLKVNGFESVYDHIQRISPKDSAKVAEGMEIIIDNWNCAPNGGVIDYIIKYLRQK
jgi:hypothetical protein